MGNLASKSTSAFFWDLSGSFVRQFLLLFITILLARLLGPKDFGIIGMAMVFISISQAFSDFGFTTGIIQQKHIKDITLSSIFFINIGISIGLSLIILLSANAIGRFYEEPRVTTILYYLAVIPPISALGKIHGTILSKKIKFKKLTIINLIAAVSAGALGVIAALLDYGVYSLVIQQITLVLFFSTLMWIFSDWRPKWHFSTDEVQNIMKFSSYVFFDNLMRQVFLRIDTLFIGKVFSPTTLGFYSRAESLKSQANAYTTTSLVRIIFPVFSSIQDDNKVFENVYLKAFKIVCGFIIILVAPIFFLAPHIIIFLLGDKWEPSVILFQILILSLLVEPLKGLMGKALLSKGFSKFHFKFGLFARFIRILPLVIGLYYGITYFAVAVVLSGFIIFLAELVAIQYKLKLSFWCQLKSFIGPNILFSLMLIGYIMYYNDINLWVYATCFLIIQLIILKYSKHQSYIFIGNFISKFIKKLRGNFLLC
jgi:O-antigen/teichoic acid export membrane protein